MFDVDFALLLKNLISSLHVMAKGCRMPPRYVVKNWRDKTK